MSDKKNKDLKKVTEMEAKAKEYLAGWQRTQADFENYKKQEDKRRQEVAEFMNAALIAEVLPIYSHFKLALKHIPEDERQKDWVVGIEHIYKQFQDFLRKFKVEEIKTVGEKFDHNVHEAIVCGAKDGCAGDVIFEEVQPGFMVEGKVLMPARVKVAK